MFEVNEYFDGNVKSLAFKQGENPATIGVMAAGKYQFGTNCIEHMTLISGAMKVKLPSESDWKTIQLNEMFVVEANTTFSVEISEDSVYLCVYF